MKRFFSLLLLLCLLLNLSAAAADATPLPDAQKVVLTHTDTKNENKSAVRLYQVKTAQTAVDEEINGLAKAYADELGANLPKARNQGDQNSRLDVGIRYSRTGLSWLSFVVQARTSFHRDLTAQSFTTRSYDMATGERLTLKDIFPEESEAWALLADAVKASINAYYPEEEADAAAVEAACTREALAGADFALHGMSLELLHPAQTFYPKHFTLIRTTLFYPDIRPMMTAAAQEATDNQRYYKMIALTFDDGPVRTNSSKVLNSLMEEGAVGTFFVIGNRVSKMEDLVQREHDEGHSIGMHNWHHGNVNKSKPGALRAMVGKCDKVMLHAIGMTAKYDRVPYGLYPKMIKSKVGWPYIQWSIDTYDWRGRSTRQVTATVKAQLHDGAIVLMHDIKDHTPDSVKKIVQMLNEQGYMTLTIDELFAKDGVTLQRDEVYFRCEDGDTTIKKRR